MIPEESFHEPVMLLSERGERAIRSPREAVDALHGDWPEARGKWYHAARRACSSAAEGRTSAHIARRIFVQAADESRLSV